VTVLSALLVLIGGAVGAPLRYLTDQAVQTRHDTVFPWGTFTVNIVGSAVLGLVTGAFLATAAPHSVQLLVGVGFCGALTTYSTFSYETLRLYEDGASFYALANVIISVAAALGAAFTGAAVAQAAWPEGSR
jgi:fluoride exporter